MISLPFSLEAAVALYIVLNVIAFALYGVDKRRAIKGLWRIRESTLIIMSFFGPVGGVLGMKAFSHKTNKPKFKLVYVFLALHVLVVVYLIARRLSLI